MSASFINKIINRAGDTEAPTPEGVGIPTSDAQGGRSVGKKETELTDESSDWLEDGNEGQLSVDVFQTSEHVVIKSTIAGVKPEDIDVSINNDMITIRGERHQEEEIQEDDYYYQECYWGAFSRSIILPVEVKSEEVDATLKNGVLTVKLPKAKKSKSVSVTVNAD
jgi:HSP20 family protein